MADALFQSGNITITRSVAKFGNSTYPIANIGSVTIESESRTIAGLLVMVAIGGGIWSGISAGWIAGLAFFGVAIFLAMKVPDKRKLTLKTSSGDVTALSSSDVKLVENVREAIESAFAR